MTARRVVRLAVPLLAATALLAGCGGSASDQAGSVSNQAGRAPDRGESASDQGEPVPIEGVGASIGGSVAPLAQCRDWVGGSIDERMATIADIRGQLTPQTSENENSGLPDEKAYDLFERVCARDYAAAFRLYKVYSQRAGFEPLVP